MSPDLASERSAVVATYSTRRDAEIALDRLESEGLDAFLSADDAGGMHPHLQETHGVRIVVLETHVSQAVSVLEDAGLLPESGTKGGGAEGVADRPGPGRSGGSHSGRPAEEGRFPVSVTSGAFIVILIVIVLALLVLTLMPG